MSAHVARNSAFNLVAQIAIKALSFLFTVYVVRDLGPEAYGTYAAIGQSDWAGRAREMAPI